MNNLNKELEEFLNGAEKRREYNKILKGCKVVPVEQMRTTESKNIYKELLYKKIYRGNNWWILKQ